MTSLDSDRPRLSLDGPWSYAIEGDVPGEDLHYPDPALDVSSWPVMELPTNWYLTEVGDHFGTLWFRRTFEVPDDLGDDLLILRFEGVDYVADVWLNGTHLGRHEGMFDPFAFDVTDVVDGRGTNVVVVKDAAPRDPTEYVRVDGPDNPLSPPYRTHQAKAITQIKGHMIDAMHRPGAMTSFRSDGNSGGIWAHVELIVRPRVHVDMCTIVTTLGRRTDRATRGDVPDGSALVRVEVTVRNATVAAIETDLGLVVAPATFEGPSHSGGRRVVLPPGESVHTLVLTVLHARLWWTWDRGRPDLYTATITVEDDEVVERFGIKELGRDEDTGQWWLNGERLFLRGMRYISSLWMSEAHEAMWADDLTRMHEMEINAIRIGSHVEKDGFYALCDERGFLVWQVFPLHYAVSDDDDMIARASDQIRAMGIMLTNHACLGMWSVFKEPEVYLLPDSPNDYHRLCPILRDTLRTVDPVRWIHLGDYREGVINLMIGYCWDGDTHLDEVALPPQIVEFGAGSVPVAETLRTFVPEDALWPPDWDTWEYHGFFYDLAFGYAKIEMHDTLEDFIDAYQAYEALVVKEQVEYLRRRKYRPVASMFHYYWRDPCPIMGSGLYDHADRPYRVAEAFRAVYGRVLIGWERDVTPYVIGREKVYARGDTVAGTVWVANDHPDAIDAEVRWDLTEQETGGTVLAGNGSVTLPSDGVLEVGRIDWQVPPDARAGAYRVSMRVLDAEGLRSANSTEIVVA